MSPITLLYETERLLVVDKPSGLLSVPGRTADKSNCVLSRLRQSFPEALVVHRLDRDTSGLLVFARDEETQRSLGRQFEQRSVAKTYTAIVEGIVTDNQRIDLPMRRDITVSLPPTYIVDRDQGREAITDLEVASVSGDRTRVTLRPRTGRSHQLRVHCKAIGHPIVGDPIYGNPINGERLMLHAHKLSFRNPATHDMLEFESPVPF
ncbi:MAG: RluA family pseudouridine synthase [Planctomycetales bacterium]|nr:RluA family pseudouridine synthase [Planctomycetales bacterium]